MLLHLVFWAQLTSTSLIVGLQLTQLSCAGIMKLFKGHVAHLLRHPCGVNVIDALYNEANPKQQAAMAAELYGSEYVLFSGEAKRLRDLMQDLPPAKQKAVLRNIAQHAIPIMEKALVDSPLGHRSVPVADDTIMHCFASRHRHSVAVVWATYRMILLLLRIA